MAEPIKQRDEFPAYSDIAKNVKLIQGLKLPNGALSQTGPDWVRTVRALIEYMVWPTDQWEVRGVVAKPRDNSAPDGVTAKVSFLCNGEDAVVNIGVFKGRNGVGRVLLERDASGGVLVDDRAVDFTQSNGSEGAIDTTTSVGKTTPFSDIIEKMASKVHEHIINTAWNSSDPKTKA